MNNNYFRSAGDLDGNINIDKSDNIDNVVNKYFYVPTDKDLGVCKKNIISNNLLSDEEKINYLKSIVSTDYDNEGEIVDCGSMILSFDRIVKLVQDGYNIINFEYFNSNLISVVFRKIDKNSERKVR